MKTLTSDARSFVHGVVGYLRKAKKPSAIPAVRSLFAKVTAQAKGEREALVETPHVLTTQQRQILSGILSDLVGHQISLRFRQDRSLVAGMRIQVADWIVDTSLRGQLDELQRSLTQT